MTRMTFAGMDVPHALRKIVAHMMTLILLGTAVPAVADGTPALTVRVVEARTMEPISGATVALTGLASTATATSHDGYVFATLRAGSYRVEVSALGYDAATRTILVGSEGGVVATFALQRSDAATAIPTIASVRAVATDRPDTGIAVHTTLGGATLAQAGAFRLADALMQVPGLNATANGLATQANGPGSSIYMDVRGLGAIETLSMVDGHPIAQGIDLGYNYQNAPIFGLQDVYVGYGTGAAGLSAYGTAGGIIDMRTLEPTATPRVRYLQGIGSYGRATSALGATGSSASGRIGYAVAYGVEGSDGPLGHRPIYAPTASWDASSPAYRSGATFMQSEATVRRSFLGKVRFRLGASSFLTVHALTNDSTADGTGNSDDVFLTPAVASSRGRQLLAGKGAGDPCPPGTFMAVNAFGIPNGLGRDFAPDGGVMCQTPSQYAQFNQGWQNFGPHRVTNTLGDYGLRLDAERGMHHLALDAFANAYSFYYDRTQFLPYFAVPGDTGFSLMQTVANAGVSLSDHVEAGPHQFGVLYRYLNTPSSFAVTGAPLQAPTVHERAFAVQDVWRAPFAPLVTRIQLAATASSATGTSFLDPHADVEYAIDGRDRVRISAGSAAVQPPGAWLGLPFVPMRSAQFVADLDCTGTNSIGTAPSGVLKPERAYDSDLAFTHDWSRDDSTSVAAYSENLFDKIYNTTVPLSMIPDGTISPAALAAYQTALQTGCGAASPATLGMTGYFNVGRVQARGIEIAGRQHLARRLTLAYGWSEESAILRSANLALLQANTALILDSQLPNVPAHKASLRLEYVARSGMDASFTEQFVSANNPADLPAYSYANVEIGIPAGRAGRMRLIVNNLFDQFAGNEANIGLGYPLPLNAYAPAGAYVPFVGASATTMQYLGPRRFEVTFQIGK